MNAGQRDNRRQVKYARRGWQIAGLGLALVLAGLAYFLVPPYLAYWQYEPREGDLVFQSLPRSPLVNTIEGASHSPFSHCGILAREDGRWVVYEAFTKVEKTPWFLCFARSRDHQFAVYRLKDEYQQHIPAMLEYARRCMGRPYDIRYEMDDEKLYCSELLFKAFQSASGEPLGKLVRLGDLDWQPYRSVIEHLEGGPAPLDRQMISPRAVTEAPQLELVTSYGIAAKP
jgi:hypothetical protein